MKTILKTHQMLSVLLAVVVLAGCASTAPTKTGDEYAVFYEGESEATYSTAFPVATPAEAYANGDRASQLGDYDRALFEYIRGLRLDEQTPVEVLYKIGNIHYARHNHQLAGLAYRWVLEIEPAHAAAGTGLGLLYLENRQYEAARERLEAVVNAVETAPWKAYNALGILADMEDEPQQAEWYYLMALSANPGSPMVLNNLGYSRYLVGDWAGAREALQDALRVDASYELAWRNLGLVHAREKNYRSALEALGRTGDESEAYNDIGYVSMMAGDYGQALTFFNKAMDLSPAFYVTASENARNAQRMIRRNTVSQ